eukprot:TRINITY_DN62143_c0_g1_i1.p1 TRINITY_DN62143_c0_g1~~TRINITY_DN62143_c0_g1_i1.p1  ORF type:complete len:605 (+),score=99.38 TRINITY_DN62143_c0_g1_i1:133-1815(+)
MSVEAPSAEQIIKQLSSDAVSLKQPLDQQCLAKLAELNDDLLGVLYAEFADRVSNSSGEPIRNVSGMVYSLARGLLCGRIGGGTESWNNGKGQGKGSQTAATMAALANPSPSHHSFPAMLASSRVSGADVAMGSLEEIPEIPGVLLDKECIAKLDELEEDERAEIVELFNKEMRESIVRNPSGWLFSKARSRIVLRVSGGRAGVGVGSSREAIDGPAGAQRSSSWSLGAKTWSSSQSSRSSLAIGQKIATAGDAFAGTGRGRTGGSGYGSSGCGTKGGCGCGGKGDGHKGGEEFGTGLAGIGGSVGGALGGGGRSTRDRRNGDVGDTYGRKSGGVYDRDGERYVGAAGAGCGKVWGGGNDARDGRESAWRGGGQRTSDGDGGDAIWQHPGRSGSTSGASNRIGEIEALGSLGVDEQAMMKLQEVDGKDMDCLLQQFFSMYEQGEVKDVSKWLFSKARTILSQNAASRRAWTNVPSGSISSSVAQDGSVPVPELGGIVIDVEARSKLEELADSERRDLFAEFQIQSAMEPIRNPSGWLYGKARSIAAAKKSGGKGQRWTPY